MNSRASASMVPHSGVGGWAPMPRKPSAAASRMAFEKLSVAWTISGARQLGRMVISISRMWPGAGEAGRDHVFAVLFGHHRGAGQAGEMRLQHDGDGDHGVDEAGPEDGDQHQRQQQRGEGQDDVHDAHDDDIDDAAEIAGEQAEDHARDQRRW